MFEGRAVLRDGLTSAPNVRAKTVWQREFWKVGAQRPPPLKLALFFLAYVIGCGIAQWLAIVPGTGISLWLPAGLFVAVLIASERQSWPWWIGTALLAELAGNALWFHNSLPIAILLNAGNAAHALIAAWCLQRFGQLRGRLQTLGNVLAFIVIAAMLAPIVSATIGAATLVVSQGQTFGPAWFLWWIGDATGVLIVGPLVLDLWKDWRQALHIPRARRIEVSMLALALFSLTALSLGGFLPFAYIVIPPLLWAAVRFEFRGVALAIIFMAAMAAIFTGMGVSPFVGVGEAQRQHSIMLHLFLATTAASALVVAALARQQRRAFAALVATNKQLEARVEQRSVRLRESEARLRTALEVGQLGMVSWQPATGAVAWDAEARQILGLSLDDAESFETWKSLVHPDDLDRVMTKLQRALDPAHDAFEVEYRIKAPIDGTERWIGARGRMLFAQGQPIQLIGTIQNLTARKLSVLALTTLALRERAQAAELTAIYHGVPVGIVLFDRDLQFLRVNDVLATINGRPADDHIGRHVTEILPPVTANALQSIRARLLAGENSVELDLSGPDLVSGKLSHWHVNYRAIRDEHNVLTHIVGTVVDITQKHEAEVALRESEARFRTLADSAPVLIWVNDDRGCILVNKAYREFVGVDETIEVSGEAWSAYVHPDDCDRYVSAYKGAFARSETFDAEFRFRRWDGAYRWMRSVAMPRRDSQGRSFGYVGATYDIHEAKELEDALRVSEQRYRGIFENAGTGVAIADLIGRYTSCNPAYAAIVGYTEYELKSRTIFDHVHPDDRDQVSKEIKCLLHEEVAAVEVHNRFLGPSDNIVHVHQHVSLLRDADDVAVGIVALVTDMTEQKKAEKHQQVLLNELAHRGKNMLAVIQSIANRTLSGDTSLEAGREAFIGRLHALANTYAVLTEGQFEGVLLQDVLAAEFRPFGPRVQVRGPGVVVPARNAQTFALMAHELATNALKYGALSKPAGRVTLKWDVVDEANGERRFALRWQESNGPPVSEPRRKGFGSTIIATVTGASLGCQPVLEFLPDGFRYSFEAPLRNVGTWVEESSVRARLVTPVLRDFYDCWASLIPPGRRLPSLKAFNCQRFRAKGGLTLAEIDGEHVRFIEMGQSLSAALSGPVSELAGLDDRAAWEGAYRRCAEGAAPSYENLAYTFPDGALVTFERLLLPFSSDGSRVSHLASYVVFSGLDGSLRNLSEPPVQTAARQ